jgi:hypothetical protein
VQKPWPAGFPREPLTVYAYQEASWLVPAGKVVPKNIADHERYNLSREPKMSTEFLPSGIDNLSTKSRSHEAPPTSGRPVAESRGSRYIDDRERFARRAGRGHHDILNGWRGQSKQCARQAPIRIILTKAAFNSQVRSAVPGLRPGHRCQILH